MGGEAKFLTFFTLFADLCGKLSCDKAKSLSYNGVKVMKSLVLWLLVLITSGITTTGCHPDQEIQVESEDGVSPYAGTWAVSGDSGDNRWQVTFDESGQLVSFINNAGIPITVEEGGAIIQLATGEIITYYIGQCNTEYDASNRLLNLSINDQLFIIEHPDGRQIEGYKSDNFVGTISEDGHTWTTNWRDIGQVIGWATEDPDRPGKTLVFHRIENTAP